LEFAGKKEQKPITLLYEQSCICEATKKKENGGGEGIPKSFSKNRKRGEVPHQWGGGKTMTEGDVREGRRASSF